MALPGSGLISITDIVTEFGGVAPHNLTEYYRGGVFVPDYSHNDAVPTSGAISITDFYGAVDPTISLPASINILDSQSGAAQAGILFQRDGQIAFQGSGPSTPSSSYDWSDPNDADIGLSFDVRLDYVSGQHINGGLSEGVWYQATTTRTWLLNSASGTQIFNGTLRIRPAGGGSDIDTVTVRLEAESEL